MPNSPSSAALPTVVRRAPVPALPWVLWEEGQQGEPSRSSQWNAWIEFFLTAIIEQAEENSTKARQILELYELLKEKALALTHSQYAVPLLDRLFKDPVFRSSSLAGQPGMPSKPMIMQMSGRLKRHGMLPVVREGSGRRPQILALKALVNLCEGKRVL